MSPRTRLNDKTHMFDPFELFAGKKKGKFSKCWLAATLSIKKFQRKFRSLTINEIDVCQINDIKNMIEMGNNEPSGKVSLYLSSQLMYGVTKILLCQTSYLEKNLIELENMFDKIIETDKRDEEKNDSLNVPSTSSEQLHEAFKLLPYEPNIDTKLRNMMHDADCLEFGALTEEKLRFLNQPDADFSTLVVLKREMFERMHITNDASLYNANTLTDSEEFYIPFDRAEKEMIISLVRDDLTLRNEEHRTAFAKVTLPEVTVEEFMPEESTYLTPRKRQPAELTHIETPTKRRRLRFEDVAVPNKDEIATIPETEVVPIPVPIPDYSIEPLQDLESMHEDPQQIKIKSKKKRILADKNTKLSHKVIRKWISNVNGHTVPLSMNNVNISTSEILFQAAPARFVSIRKNKWNSPLIKLFSMHVDLPSIKKKTQMDFQLLEKCIAFIKNKSYFSINSFNRKFIASEIVRLGEKSNKTDELLAELSVIKSTDASAKSIKETSVHETMSSHQELVIPNIEQQIDLQNIEQGFGLLNITRNGTGPNLTIHEKEIDQSQETIKLSQSYLLTKLDLLALLEVLWHDTELVRFTDVIPPGQYSKADAACCYLLLLELHQEKKITLEQAMPYDTLWIKKFPNGN
ncbi:hypothetical protein V1478_004573 [Vespula squamosa]|uniref:Rad21/Rec8-like protein N-terminal domain-containing protein n=1 Tax=Vespula squamosa TaxID=30214 RepID=A0ABD2BGK6_VESSQ